MARLSLLGLLRSLVVLVSAVLVATLLPRFGVPARATPDLVVVAVIASAVLRGPVHGALLGLGAGWVVDLVPPAGSPLGVTALLYAVAGATAGTFSRPGNRGPLVPLAALAAAAATVRLGELALGVLGHGPIDPAAAATQVAATVVVGVALMPAFISLDRSLVRRRLG